MKRLFSPVAPLITGFLLGCLLSTLVVTSVFMYLLQSIRSGEWSQQSAFVQSVGQQIRQGVLQYESTSIYGHIVSIENGILTLDTDGAAGPQIFTFAVDADTEMVRLNNDENSTEIPITQNELMPGEGITVITEQPVGGSEGQRVVKLVKL